MRRFPRILFGILTVIMTLLGTTGCGETPEPPHLVLITVDTLRAGNLHCYGYPLTISPTVDALADRGLRFETCLAHASSTAPALASLLTGVYPSEAGVMDNAFPLHESMDTLAEALGRRGYRTAAFVSNFNLRKRMGFFHGFDHYDAELDDREVNRATVRERTADRTTEAARAWLDAEAGKDGRPFFLWVHYQDPHGPYTPPETLLPDAENYAAFDRELPLRDDNIGDFGIPAYQALEDRRDEAFYRARYDGEIAYLDGYLANLLEALDRPQWKDRLAVIFTADHGESMGEHGFWFSHEQDLHDELIRVPLIVTAPDLAPARITERACHIDLFPTVLALAGERDLSGYRGVNLLDASARKTTRGLYAETNHRVTRRVQRSLVLGPFKLIRSPLGEADPKLYDISKDPGETNNLYAERPEVAEAMMKRLLEHERIARSGKQGVKQAFSEEDERILEALGYTGK